MGKRPVQLEKVASAVGRRPIQFEKVHNMVPAVDSVMGYSSLSGPDYSDDYP